MTQTNTVPLNNNTTQTDTIQTFQLSNNQGDEITLCNYGARIVQWNTRINGSIRNIVLGFSNPEDYLNDSAFLGAIVGPFANRIGGASFSVNEKTYSLNANEGNNQLHGGPNAFGQLFWQIKNNNEQGITFSCHLVDGYNGYPGPINAEVTYELTNNSELIISGCMTSAQLTAIGPTSHPYFNLMGHNQPSQSHSLQINASHYTPTNSENIPTGEIASVEGTPLDFRQTRTLNLGVGLDDLDNNFVVDDHSYTSHANNQVNKQAVLTSPDESLALHVSSNLPGVQVYTGRYLDKPFKGFQGICLEPQFFPDSPNKPHFPFELTGPNMPLHFEIIYGLVKG